jgi:DNA-binding transcriptional MocR family regulator
MSKTIWQPRLPKDGTPVYRAIADALERDLAAGVLRAGSRLPTHRALAALLGVTTLTVTRAYNEASRRGLLESTVGRGTFVRTDPREDQRAPVDLSRNIIGGAEDLDLARDLPAELRRIVRSPDYQSPAGGSGRYKAAAAAWIGRAGLTVAADRPLVVPGAQHALTILFMTLLEPRGTILCEPLTYPALRPLLALLRITAEIVDIDEEGINPKSLDQMCRSSRARVLYCVPTFQNPTGAVMSKERRQDIAAVARRHGLTIIEDDVYGFLLPAQPPTIASLLPEQTCYVTTTSKSISPSLRIGFIAAPAALLPRLESAVYATVSFASAPSAEIFTSLVESGEADRIVEKKRKIIREHQRVARRILGNRIKGTHEMCPHIWLGLPEEWDAQDFAQESAARGVSIAPSSVFALDRRQLRNAVRVAVGAAPNAADLQAALETIVSVMTDGRRASLAMV